MLCGRGIRIDVNGKSGRADGVVVDDTHWIVRCRNVVEDDVDVRVGGGDRKVVVDSRQNDPGQIAGDGSADQPRSIPAVLAFQGDAGFVYAKEYKRIVRQTDASGSHRGVRIPCRDHPRPCPIDSVQNSGQDDVRGLQAVERNLDVARSHSVSEIRHVLELKGCSRSCRRVHDQDRVAVDKLGNRPGYDHRPTIELECLRDDSVTQQEGLSVADHSGTLRIESHVGSGIELEGQFIAVPVEDGQFSRVKQVTRLIVRFYVLDVHFVGGVLRED